MKYILIIIFCLLLQACSKVPSDLKAPQQVDNSLTLKVTKNNIPADNYSYAEISAILKKRPAANDLIVFTADKGLFANNSNIYSVNVSSNDTTKAYIKYNKAEVVRITAIIFGNDTKEVYATFLQAYPSQILIYPDVTTLPTLFTSKSLITAKLVRPTGMASEGLSINFYDSAATSSLRSIGSFLNSTYSNSQGNATVEYWIQDTSYHGFVYIKGYINSDTGKVMGGNRIFIQ